VLFGSAGGRLKTGLHVNYQNEMKVSNGFAGIPSGRPYNRLLVTLLQAMGLAPADYEAPGQKGYGLATSQDPRRMKWYGPLLVDVGRPLPELMTA